MLCNSSAVATNNIHFAAAPAPATTPSGPAGGAAACTASGTGSSAMGSSEGLSFNDLMNDAVAGGEAGGASAASADDGHAADGSGEELPPDGNALPLVLPVLPPVVTATAPVAEAVEENVAVATSSAPQTALPPPVVTAASTEPATDGSARESGASADEIAQALNGANARAAHNQAQTSSEAPAAQSGVAQDKPLPPHPRPAHEAASAHKTETAPAAQATPSTDEAATSALAARLAQGADQDVGGLDDADLRRRLSSLPTDTGVSKPADRTAALQHAAQASAAAANASVLDAPSTNGRADMPAANAAQQLLREFRFERSSEGISSSSSVNATHTGGLQPAATSVAADKVPVTQLPTPVQNSQQWADGLGDRVVWMTNNNLQNAQIRLNPAHLGPIDVQVSVTGDQTNVSFTAHHAATRDALEAAAPRLRDLLGSQGMTNVNVNINHQSSGDRLAQNAPQESWGSYAGTGSDEGSAVADNVFTSTARSTRALIDTYA